MTYPNVYELVTSEENAYQTQPVSVVDNYEWSMADHIKKTVLYMNGQFLTGDGDNKPNKNIIRPILNLEHRAEGFDVKDITLFVNDFKNFYKSFLVKKFHDKWARENHLDTFIDQMVETYVDYGGVLVKDVNQTRPEVVPWQRVAFCDQTDILSGIIAEKHFYSPDQLKEFESKGWKNIDEVIILAENYKKDALVTGKQSRTPGKYIEVYEVHGMFPRYWLDETSNEVQTKETMNDYVRQLHIITFYTDQNGNKQGITLFQGKEQELPYKILLRDEIYGRALGMGGAEELFEPQVWINYDMIRIKEMLDIASKVLFQTSDSAFATRNQTSNLQNGEILITDDGKAINPINTSAVNITVFENSVNEWLAHAQMTGAANDSIMGEAPSAGTPFKLQELVTQESHSLHDYRKGKLATFLNEIYQDWIIPHISREITKGQKFLAELTLEELQQVAENLVICETERKQKERVLNGELVLPEQEVEMEKQKMREEFMRGGNKRFIEILKDELKGAPLDIEVNIAGKQKNLTSMVDKLTNIVRQIIASVNPQTGQSMLDDPRIANIFNQILEASGLNPIDFYQRPKQPPPNQLQAQNPVQAPQANQPIPVNV